MRRLNTLTYSVFFLLLPICPQAAELRAPKSFTVESVPDASGQVLIIVDTSNLATNMYLQNVQVFIGFYDDDKKLLSSQLIGLGTLQGGQQEVRFLKAYAVPHPSARYMKGERLQVVGDVGVLGGRADSPYQEVTIAPRSGFIDISPTKGKLGTKGSRVSPQLKKELARIVPSVPRLISPSDGTVFEHFSIKPVLRWSDVPGAFRYGVEIDCFNCCQFGKWCSDVGGKTTVIVDLIKTQYVFDANPQPYRWRVWAVGADGTESAKSSWWTLSYR